MADMKLERRSGVSLWRQVADAIRQHELPGMAPGTRIPPETELARRFGVNRHTVRAAIAALESEGILRAEQGRGTFFANRRRLRYPISRRTRFSAGLGDQISTRELRILATETETATAEIAEALALPRGHAVIRIDTVALADGVALNRARAWFDPQRFPDIAGTLAGKGSYTAALAELGVPDYLRKSTLISASHADTEDLAALNLSPGAIVMITRSVNVDPDGQPIQYAETRFAADRMEFVIREPTE